MPLFFIIFGLASAAMLVLLLGSLLIGAMLYRTQQFKTVALFVLFVPTVAAATAVAASWGLAFWIDSMSQGAASLESWQRWGVLAFWAWPAGFVIGGVAGAAAGAAIAAVIVKRRGAA